MNKMGSLKGNIDFANSTDPEPPGKVKKKLFKKEVKKELFKKEKEAEKDDEKNVRGKEKEVEHEVEPSKSSTGQ